MLVKVKVPNGTITIKSEAYYNEFDLKKVSLPKTLKLIEKDAFSKCSSLKSIKIPNSVVEIGNGAFSLCSKLKSIKLPADLTKISNKTFFGCLNLKNIEIPKSVKTIEDSAFYKTESLSKINLPENLENLGENAFEKSGLKSIEIPKAITTIPKNAFSSCTSLTSIVLPENLKRIDESAFYKCSKLEDISIPTSVLSIGKNAFENCSSINNILLPNNLTKIEDSVFLNCHNLQNINIHNDINYIGDSAFENCEKLSNIVLPNSLTYLGSSAFKSTNISEINIPENINIIKNETFSKTINLKNIIIPDSITSIGKNAFEYSGIKFAKLPKNLKKIQNKTFFRCYNLENVDLPKNLESIELAAFYYCESLKSIDLPDTLKSISEFAFQNCSSLKEIKLPKGITEINKSTFENCSSLENIELHENLTSIGEKAFDGCSNLTQIEIPESVENIEAFAFANCDSLEKIKLPKNLIRIDSYTFSNCSNLKEIEIPEKIIRIRENAFDGCTSLEKIIIPKSVKTIGDNAFQNCSNLKLVYIPNSLVDFYAINTLIEEHKGNDKSLKYLSKTKDGFYLSASPMENSIKINDININLEVLNDHWKYYNPIINEQKNPFIAKFYNTFINKISIEYSDVVNNFINNHNFTFYKKLQKFDDGNMKFSINRLLFNLGVFEKPIKVNNKNVDYAQKITNFLLDRLDSNQISMHDLFVISRNINNIKFKPEFTDFFMENFDKLIEVENENGGFIARCYDEFEYVQKTNTSHRGHQRQLKPTVEKFVNYFDNSKFMYVTDETYDIAQTIAPYYNDQEAFDNAVKIFKEFKNNNVPTSITKTRVIDQNSPFTNIDKIEKTINHLKKDTIKNLTETATNEFTFDWLEKNDPNNLILGKLCSCCAHLEGVGYGIMHASIVHPDIQNMVIRNNSGEIIAKATLYVNRKHGYGVFNAVEVNNYYFRESKESKFKDIYNTIIRGVDSFAKQYNLENPTKKLKIITVGCHYNNFVETLERNAPEQDPLLESFNYGEYGIDLNNYDGDADVRQFVLWKLNKNIHNEQEKENLQPEK